MSKSRILKAVEADIAVSFYEQDAEAPSDPGVVTVTITRANGDAIATDAVTGGTDANPRTFSLDTDDTAQVDQLTAVWTSVALGQRITTHEIVGGVHVELAEIRALQDLSSAAEFPLEELIDARDWWEELSERWCRVAFVPRFAIDVVKRSSDGRVFLSHRRAREVLSAKDADSDDVGFSDWTLHSSGEITGSTITSSPIEVTYEHGHDAPDSELRETALTAIRGKLLADRSGRPSRETLLTNELGTVRLAQPGKKAATGLPEVDNVLNRRREPAVLVR